MGFKYNLEENESGFYPDYIFRITDGNTPFKIGSWSKQNTQYSAPFIYTSPVIYTWIRHWFENKGDRIFVIHRPKSLAPSTMCCGLNSHYHFCFTKHPELLDKMRNAVLTKNFRDPDLKKIFKEHEDRVMQKFGKKLSEMKGGTYLGTLGEFDSNHPSNAYPEIIIDPRELQKCEWEELTYIGKTSFQGKKSKKIFKIEQPLEKYGERYVDRIG